MKIAFKKKQNKDILQWNKSKCIHRLQRILKRHSKEMIPEGYSLEMINII